MAASEAYLAWKDSGFEISRTCEVRKRRRGRDAMTLRRDAAAARCMCIAGNCTPASPGAYERLTHEPRVPERRFTSRSRDRRSVNSYDFIIQEATFTSTVKLRRARMWVSIIKKHTRAQRENQTKPTWTYLADDDDADWCLREFRGLVRGKLVDILLELVD